MSNKIRLVGGPFGGKVMNHPAPGNREIQIRAPRKMTRKARYEFMMEQSSNTFPGYLMNTTPMSEARYRVAHAPHKINPYHTAQAVCMHPDGSVFYEFVPGTRRDYH